jgi:hypothetical protein
MAGYLHQHPEFSDLLLILESETGIQAGLIEKTIGLCMCCMV